MTYIGTRAVGSTVYIPFTTHDTDGASIAPSSAFETADVRIYKNGSATQRSSESGYTMTSPFDSVTGLHLLAIDLSDNTDASFYAAGSHYDVVLVPDETVDSLAVVRVIAAFDIGVVPANVTQWLGTAAATPTVAGVPEVDVTHVAGSTTDVSTIPASVAAILVDTGTTLQSELDGIQADTEDIQSRLPAALVGGRIDATVDGTGMEAAAIAAIADGVWDEATTSHTTSGTFGEQLKTDVDAILADTNELQVDDTPGALAAIDAKIDTIDNFLDTEVAAILADTNELQTDLVDGGRLDLLVDAIKAKTDQLTFTVANQVDANALTLDEDEILDDSLADSVPADGSLPTVRQALYMIWQFLSEKSVSGTTLTVKKADGTTSLMTFTLDDGTSPTSITRAS